MTSAVCLILIVMQAALAHCSSKLSDWLAKSMGPFFLMEAVLGFSLEMVSLLFPTAANEGCSAINCAVHTA